MKEFEDYQKAKRKLLDYFDNAPLYYTPISALLHVKWECGRDEYMLRWIDGGEDYSSSIVSSFNGEAYKMFLVHSDFGGEELVIFDKAKELKNV